MLKSLRKSFTTVLLLGLATATTLSVQSCSSAATQDVVGPTSSGSEIVRVSVVPRSARLLVGDSLAVVAYGHLRNGDSTVVAAAWSATGGSISGAGWFRADRGGVGTVRAVSVAEPALSDSSAVEIATIELTPEDTVVSAGGSIQVSSRAILPDGSVMMTPAVTWSATGGTISPMGVFSAPVDPGIYEVSAQVTGHAASASLRIHVNPATLLAFVLNPSAVSLLAGATQQFSLAALWSNGSTALPAVAWSATGGTVSPTGLYTAGQTAGTFRVIAAATANGRADTSDVIISVPAPTLMQLVLSPKSVTLTPSGTNQYAVSGTWSDGSSTAPAVTWSATGGTITTNGLFSAGTTPGAFRVIVTQQGGTKADTATVTISMPVVTLVTLALNPHAFTIQPGGTQQFTVAGGWSDGSSATPVVTYVATGGAVTATGLYTAGTTPGSFRVIATQQGGTRADTATVTINPLPPTLSAMVLNPSSLSLLFGATQQFSVSGSWSDGSSTTPLVSYAATGGTITVAGRYTAGTTAGTFRVIATQQGGTRADTSTITVVAPPPTLITLVLNPAAVSMLAGETRQFSLAALWSNGSTTLPAVTWSATGGTISPSGLFTAGPTAGSFRVVATASSNNLADTSTVTISVPAPTLTQLIVSPKGLALTTGDVQQYVVSATWSDGSTAVPAVTWSATGGTITTNGLFSAGTTPGSFRVIVTQQGGTKADTATVTISMPVVTLVTLALNPQAITLFAGATQQFSVAGGWSNGSSGAPAVTYAATGGAITQTGAYTAGTTPGLFRVIATHQSSAKADTSAVTVRLPPPRLLSLTISPKTATLTQNGTQQFTVSGIWSDGSTNIPIATYAATGGTATQDGRYTAGILPGTFRVIAMGLGNPEIADTAIVTIGGLWGADLETRGLNQWEDNLYQTAPCGGQFNTGLGVTVPSMDYARSGVWSAKMVIDGNGTTVAPNATRLQRWCEPQRNRELFYSVWYFFPEHISIGSGGWINFFQFKSGTPDVTSDPFFYLAMRDISPGGLMHFTLTWWNGLTIDGPSPGQHGYRTWQTPQPVPVGRWVQVQARYVCAGDFTGAIQVWQDGVEIFHLEGVRTRYANGDCRWGVTNYGAGPISPSPVVFYIDDAAISTTRIGP